MAGESSSPHDRVPPHASQGLESVPQQLAAIRSQLDVMRHDMDVRNRRLAEWDELKDDLTEILKDVLQTAIVELDDVAPFMKTGDFLSLVKKLLRNTRRISESVEKLESATDFLADAQPLGDDLFRRFIVQLDQLERRGYFQLGADAARTADSLAQSLTESGLLPAIRRALDDTRELDPQTLQQYSLWKIYRATRTPEMRRLLGGCSLFLTALAHHLESK